MVVIIDAALHSGTCTVAEPHATAAGGRRGGPALRRAVALADDRAESAWESLFRLLHQICGIEVEPQYVLRDAHGHAVARADLWLVGTNAVHEYDGGEHLKVARQRKDLARARRIGNQTWIRRGYTAPDVLYQASGILRDADLSLGRPHRPERIRAWHALLRASLFTPPGQERLRQSLSGHCPTSRTETRSVRKWS